MTIEDSNECGVGSYQSSPLIEGSTVLGTGDPGTVLGCPLTQANEVFYAQGTAIFLVGQSATGLQTVITNNFIAGNSNNSDQEPTLAPGITAVDAGSVLVSGNTITDNTGSFVGGSAISVTGDTSASILQNIIFGNIETTIAAFFYTSGFGSEAAVNIAISPGYTTYLTGNTVATNHYINDPGHNPVQGTQLFVQNTGNVVISNNLFIGPDAVAPVYCASPVNQPTGAITFSHNDAYTTGGSGSFTGPECPGVLGTNGNISADPLFAGASLAAAGDFALQLASPAVDAGDNTAVGVGAVDFAGAPRIQNAKALPASIIDMGAYEHAGAPAAPPAPDFTLTASPNTVDLTSASSATVQLTLLPNSSLAAQISSACSGLPANVQCSFAPPTVSVSGGVPQTVELTLTAAQGAAAAPFSGALPGGAVWMGVLVPAGLPVRRRRLLMLAGGIVAAGLLGCGVHLNPIAPRTAVSTSSVTVTATAGTGQQHGTVLTVQTASAKGS